MRFETRSLDAEIVVFGSENKFRDIDKKKRCAEKLKLARSSPLFRIRRGDESSRISNKVAQDGRARVSELVDDVASAEKSYDRDSYVPHHGLTQK